MAMPLYEQPPPPAFTVQQPHSTHSAHGSIGPLIAVLVVIIVLGILAVMVGRLCSGKSMMGYGQFDLESWAERKCSSCIDGKINSPLPRTNISSCNSIPITMPVETHQEIDQEELSSPNPSANV